MIEFVNGRRVWAESRQRQADGCSRETSLRPVSDNGSAGLGRTGIKDHHDRSAKHGHYRTLQERAPSHPSQNPARANRAATEHRDRKGGRADEEGQPHFGSDSNDPALRDNGHRTGGKRHTKKDDPEDSAHHPNAELFDDLRWLLRL